MSYDGLKYNRAVHSEFDSWTQEHRLVVLLTDFGGLVHLDALLDDLVEAVPECAALWRAARRKHHELSLRMLEDIMSEDE